MKIAELTITFDKDTMRNQLRAEIAEAKKHLRAEKKKPFNWSECVLVHGSRIQNSYVEGYLKGMRMAIAMLDELEHEDGGSE